MIDLKAGTAAYLSSVARALEAIADRAMQPNAGGYADRDVLIDKTRDLARQVKRESERLWNEIGQGDAILSNPASQRFDAEHAVDGAWCITCHGRTNDAGLTQSEVEASDLWDAEHADAGMKVAAQPDVTLTKSEAATALTTERAWGYV